MSHTDFQNPYQTSDLAAGRRTAGWTPPPEVHDHHGGVIPPAWDFFAPPPENIGVITHAASSLSKDEQPWSTGSRAMLALGLLAGIGVLGVAVGLGFQWEMIWVVVVSGGLGLIAAAIGWFSTGFDHSVTFVGTEGCARITCNGDRDALCDVQIFRFERAAELRTAMTHHYHKGAYQQTTYDFTWTDAAGNVAYNFNSAHAYEYAMPPANDDYCYAWRAEEAWSEYLFNRLIEPIKKGGFSQFNLASGDFVRVGNGYCEFSIGGTQERVLAQDIDTYDLADGWLKIKRKGAVEGWFSSTGVFEFAYSDIANARLFLLLFENFGAAKPGAA